MYVSQTIIIDPTDAIEPGDVNYSVVVTPPGATGTLGLLFSASSDPLRAVPILDKMLEAMQAVRTRALRDAAHAEADAIESAAQ